MNEALTKLYADFFDVQKQKLSGKDADRCSAPLLISMPAPDAWLKNKRRILIVGQETYGWHCSYKEFFRKKNNIQELMNVYKDFSFGKGYHKSPFWTAFKGMGDAASGDVLWSNLFRFDLDRKSVIRGTSKDPDFRIRISNAQRGLLSKEIEILKPTAVVFFTGPSYDCEIKREFENVTIELLDEGKAFALLTHRNLPAKSFRLYHPSYLRRSGQWKQIERVKAKVNGDGAQESIGGGVI